MGIWGDFTSGVGRIWKGVTGGDVEEANKENQALRNRLLSQDDAATRFAGMSENAYGALGAESGGLRDRLRSQMEGKHSVASEQLRQGMQQGLAAQRSMAAGANSPMAARMAANNMARLGYGMSGQQALAGIQERNAAAQGLAQLLMQQRQQELQAALEARRMGIAATQGAMNPKGDQTLMQSWAPMISGISSLGGYLSGGGGKGQGQGQ